MSTNNFDPKLMRAWFDFMAQSMKSADQMQHLFDPATFQRWAQSMTPAADETPFDVYEEWLTAWQKAAGVVDRQRYLDLLEQNQELQRRLEKADETIQTLRSMLASKDAQEEAVNHVVDTWNAMLENTLELQKSWIEQWNKKD